jgi:hypothetical protein
MSSEKIEMTKTHRFSVEFFEDAEQGLFRAVLEATTPPLAQEMQPGRPVPTMKEEKSLRLKPRTDLNVSREEARLTIIANYGELLRLQVS